MNDGSKDKTLAVLRQLYREHPEKVRYLSFSRNFGKEAGLYAGLKEATGDLVTVMDVDLQDPPELLPQMIEMIEASTDLDCVGTRRVTRDGEPPIRSFLHGCSINSLIELLRRKWWMVPVTFVS